ncbi:O-methylsterigmatocystin oxidoreductase OS=Aspergillus flavus (strain ATCC 200026 / FGSC A1120 / NRRL 3357 / JCM 12722 / SRRC 167) GN=ordA PE=2 SV=1 [Rhizoctonia solani AG-1 IB]|uniref:O-methylsterigmatocystin oxidoreductase n=1 Tax=Thanatephorus cucumeris (strain AG1-IB / isolate 7/3/14) TaxID=1108050 RepID=A0A0B7FGI2_THACB|nr:O-methylsterigmatocystin oxidoreductase OS=Aspergillus flavus (strain ATCC 200026 / FGSC A1120 / NRRL 3357 / JCM 12722 / SRRC 167) GN=ordA PE=2 SV=1 [Rhizoctonia solani AG-1 IB]
MPTEYEELAYKTWGDQLGSSMVSVNLLGQVIVVLNTAEDANELLVKRALHYSNRFQIPMMSSPRLSGWGKGSGLLNYGDRWRAQRKVTHEVLQKKALKTIWPVIIKHTRRLMQCMMNLQDPQSEIARMVGAVVLQSAYGYEATKAGDPMVEIARVGMKAFSDASIPADFIVNVFPWLEYIPSWFPGAGWKRKAMAWNKAQEDLINVPFEWTRQQMANGTAQPSAISSILTEVANVQSDGDRAEEEDRIKWAIGSLYAGAIETTTATILIFILAMVHYPDIQAKIQQEVDTVVGDQRLPEIEDQDNLPYIGRVIKEVSRWRPVAPLGVPHACAKDDIYRGHSIPKGSVIMGNIWAMCSNPETYPNPDKFDPDRFIDPTTPDPPVFGFGRRICPGQDFAEASLFLTVATLLSVYDIRPAKDDRGNDIMPETKLVGHSLVRFPFPFQCSFELRSEAKRRLLFQN